MIQWFLGMTKDRMIFVPGEVLQFSHRIDLITDLMHIHYVAKSICLLAFTWTWVTSHSESIGLNMMPALPLQLYQLPFSWEGFPRGLGTHLWEFLAILWDVHLWGQTLMLNLARLAVSALFHLKRVLSGWDQDSSINLFHNKLAH